MALSDAEAEAIRIMACLCTDESQGSVARSFGCSRGAVRAIIQGRTHVGIHRGEYFGNSVHHMRAVGRDKRKKITQMLKDGPKSIREIQAALGTDPSQYLTEMRKAGKIERKFVWVLK